MKQSNKSDGKLQGELKNIEIAELKANPWNPNVMTDAQFNRLTKELETTGMIDPIQVVKVEDGYRIIGGEHRFEAAKVLGWETIPCVVLTGQSWADEDLQRFESMRLNMIRGEINPTKFLTLYRQMVEKYGDESLQDLMGVTEDDKWKLLTKGIRESLKEGGIPPEMLAGYDDAVKEIKTIDDLSLILNTLFTKYGDSLSSDFMVFSYLESDSKILYVQAEKDVFEGFSEIAEKSKEGKGGFNAALRIMLERYKEKT